MEDILSTYTYARNQLMFLKSEEMKCRQALSKSPGHVRWMARIESVKHDIKLLEPVVHKIERKVNTELQSTVGGDFKFLTVESDDNENR